jgi:hypothetical protein
MTPSTLYILLGLLGLGILISLIWRLASRRQELPCPSWLGWIALAGMAFFTFFSDRLVKWEEKKVAGS